MDSESRRTPVGQAERWEVFGLDRDVRDAFEDYVRAQGPRLVRTAYLFTGDLHIAEDVVQNALASVVASWRRLRDVSNLDAYVYRAIVNAGHRWRRRRWNGEIPFEHLPEPGSEDGRDRVEGRTDMVAALRRLPPRQRAVLVLRYFADLTEHEAAAILGCSVGTVKSQSSRGLAVLRTILQEQRGQAEADQNVESAREPVAGSTVMSRPQHRGTNR
jgi:RNA polymerase sigma-70 factor (sigma-E family)